MDFSLSEQQQMLRDSVRRFCQDNLASLAAKLDEESKPVPHSWMKRYAELGCLGVNTSTDFGGLGLSHLDAIIVLEEFAKVSVAVAFPVFESCMGPVRIVENFGAETLKQRILPQVVAGEALVAVSMSEPEAGTALTDLRTQAHVEGDHVVLNGTKRWCSGAGHSQYYLVFCRFGSAPGAKGIGAVLVDKDTPGVSFGVQERLMGFRGVPSADIALDNVRVPTDNIVVGPNGFSKLMGTFNLERLGNATLSLGTAAGALEQATAYIQERKQFGKPLIEFQAVQLRLAEMAMKTDAARLLVYRAASNAGQGMPALQEAAIAKCFANEIAREVTSTAVQLLGGYGYSFEYGAERRFRDAFGAGIAGGTIDIQKVNIASALIGRRFDQRR